MEIEVGKRYKMRGGGIARITEFRDGFNFPFRGTVNGITYSWDRGGHHQDVFTPKPLDLISPWEDSPTQDKSESKTMDEKPEIEIKQTVRTEIKLSRKDVQTILRKHFDLPHGYIKIEDGVWFEDFVFLSEEEVSTRSPVVKRAEGK